MSSSMQISESNEIVPGKETVIRRDSDSFAFRLPRQHQAELLDGREQIKLSTPLEGGIYRVVRVIEDDTEVCIVVRGKTADMWGPPGFGEGLLPAMDGYPFPLIQDELARLRNDLVAAGGSEQQAHAWAQGASHESHARWLRDEIRRLRREREDGSS